VDILRMLLKIQAAQHDVATKLLSSTEDLEAIAMEDDADVPALKGWRYEVFGREALAVKKGALAVGLKGSKIVKYKVDAQTDLWD
ncbi:MAG TPA: ribonuclease D, partial [Alphaproteobacteria bacterium]|nr:ribonuclease D [Alphaproteobacteria bacterium]